MTGQARRGRRAAAPPRTLGELVRHGTRLFRAQRLAYGHGTTRAFDEAAWLALHAAGLPPDSLAPHLDRRLTKRSIQRALALFERRIRERKPAAYLIGEAWLAGFRFYVDERVIVPRSYLAELLREDLAPWIRHPRRIRTALDLCTGSGCLAVMLAASFPEARIDAADISRDALRVARRNVNTHALANRVRLVRSDLFSALRGERYDLIVSNPPYVTARAMRRLPPEYRWEPRLALAGGADGLALVHAILRGAAGHLNPGGLLVVEIGHNRARLERAYPRVSFIWPETSGGEDCVLLLGRDALLEISPPAPRARAAAASPPAARARTAGRA